jgi:hypothetical protein
VGITGEKKRYRGIAHGATDQARRRSISAAPRVPAVRTVAVQKPGVAFGVTGESALSAIIPGDAAGEVTVVSSGDTGGSGVVAPGTAVVTAGATVLSTVRVAAGTPDEEEEEPSEPEDDVTVAAGVAVCDEPMLPLRTTSKSNGIN